MKKLISTVLFIALLSMVSGIVFAEQLLKSSHSWDGGEISYPKGEAEITALRLTLKAGQSTPFHCHPVPTFGHMVKGQLKVETTKGQHKIVNAGDSIIEVMKTTHRGTAIEDSEIMVYYAGAKGIPHTVAAHANHAKNYCDS